jgi:hypothetical protein
MRASMVTITEIKGAAQEKKHGGEGLAVTPFALEDNIAVVI